MPGPRPVSNRLSPSEFAAQQNQNRQSRLNQHLGSQAIQLAQALSQVDQLIAQVEDLQSQIAAKDKQLLALTAKDVEVAQPAKSDV